MGKRREDKTAKGEYSDIKISLVKAQTNNLTPENISTEESRTE